MYSFISHIEKCAVNVGASDAYRLAQRSLPLLETLSKLVLREHAIVEEMFSANVPNKKYTVESTEENI